MDVNKYGDYTPRQSGYAYKELLTRSLPMMVTGITAQSKPLPKNQTGVVIFRRYNSLSAATTPLSEGVTPAGSTPTSTDVTVAIQQYGAYIPFSDKMVDLHPDNIITEFGDILSEQMALTRETLNFSVLKAGTTAYYAPTSAITTRGTVVSFTTVGQLKKIVRYLRNQKARPFSNILKATPNYATNPIAASFIAYCPEDAVADLQGLAGWKDVETYADSDKRIHDYERGAVANIRFLATPVLTAWADSGAADATSTYIATTNAAAAVDVYPIIILGKDAWAEVPLQGTKSSGVNSGSTTLIMPKPSASDPLGQRGYVGWKFYQAGVILDDTRMARVEVACTLNPTS